MVHHSADAHALHIQFRIQGSGGWKLWPNFSNLQWVLTKGLEKTEMGEM